MPGGVHSVKKTLTLALLSATIIGSMFFAWATYVNWGHGLELAFRSGAGQGTVSFVVSMSMAFMLEYFFFLPVRKLFRIPFAVVSTMSIVVAVTVVVHVLIGTPEIITTMALPFFMGVVYTSLYSVRLSRMDSAESRDMISDN
jgi:hypothetical protein